MKRRLGRRTPKWGLAGMSLVLVSTACGGSMSPDEYVEGLNSLVADAGPDLDSSAAAYEQIVDPTIEDWNTFVEREIELRQELSAKFDALEPPDSIEEVHQIVVAAVDRGSTSAEALAAVAASASTPSEAEATPEYAEYVAANAEGSSSVCRQVQGRLDDLASSGEPFADTPWLPSLTLTVRATLGCIE